MRYFLAGAMVFMAGAVFGATMSQTNLEKLLQFRDTPDPKLN